MPPLTEQDRRAKLLAISVEDVNEMYRDHDITAGERNRLLHDKVRATTGSMLDEQGYVGAILSKSIQNLQDGWNNLKESAMRTPEGIPTSGKALKNEAYYLGLAMWGQIQMLTSVFNAVGEITGAVAEREALRWGASPGLARTLNIATDIATGFLPVGAAAKSYVQGVRGYQQYFAAARKAKALKAQEKAAEAVKEATEAMAEGLAKESPEAAANLLRQAEVRRVASTAEPLAKKAAGAGSTQRGAAAQRAAEKGMADEEGERVLRSIEEKIAAETPSSVRDQFLKDFERFSEEMKSITATQAHEQTSRLAAKLGYTVDDVRALFPGQALNEAQMLAYLKAIEPQTKTLFDLAEKAAAARTEVDATAMAQHLMEFFTFAPKVRSASVTGGRIVDIHREAYPMKQITEMLTAFDAENMAKGNFTEAMLTVAEDLVELKKQPEKLTDLVLQGQSLWQRFKDKGWPTLRTAYINLLLARPITQVRNFLGNSVAATNAVMDRMAAGAFSASEKGVVNGEAFYLMKGMAYAQADAFSAFKGAFARMSPEEASRFDVAPERFTSIMGRLVQGPGDLMRGMDNYFKTIFTRGSFYAQAMREGSQRGLSGDDLAAFMAHRVAHPTERMIVEANEFALSNTFQNELGGWAKSVQRLGQSGPLVLWFPFMKTPINLAKYAWDRTPGLQLVSKGLYEDIKQGGPRADMAIGRLTMSFLQAQFLFEMAKEGLITGSGPVDPALRRVWLQTNTPYSVRTKSGAIPISNVEPGNTVLGLIADYAQVMNQLDEPTAGQAGMAIAFSLMHNFADKTYWQTLSDLVDVASGIERGYAPGKSFMDVVLGPATAVATGGPAGQSVTRALDPIPREARGFVDTVISKIPGYSKTYPPRRDPAYGEVALPPQAVGGQWVGMFSPLTVKSATDDPVIREGERLGIEVPKWPESIGGTARDDFDIRQPFPEDRLPIEIDVWQRDRWMQIYRNLIRHPEYGVEVALMADKEYQGATRALQREMFMDLLASHRKTAEQALLVEDVELGKKVFETTARRYLPMTPHAQRPQVEKDIAAGLSLFEKMAPQERNNLLKWGILDTPDEPSGTIGFQENAPKTPAIPQTTPQPIPMGRAAPSPRTLTPVVGR